MGYGNPALPLWERLRPLFPVTQNLTYLNHAAVTPIPAPVADAHTGLAADVRDWGSYHYDKWLQIYENIRIVAARLLNAKRGEIAIVKNTSEGIATIALGLAWKSGDRVVAFRQEFPANYYPWLRLAQRGVEVTWLDVDAPLEAVDRACRGARLLAVSHVNYLTGYRVDLDAFGEICRRQGTFFFVDAIQGLGAYSIDVRRSHIGALAADGHKWLLGPEGCGILYIRRDLQDSVEPVEFGWTNVAHYADYGSRDMTLRPDAGRYECGTLNTIGIFGLEAAIRLILELGLEQITPAVDALSDRVAQGVLAKGYELAAPRRPGTPAALSAFGKKGSTHGWS